MTSWFVLFLSFSGTGTKYFERRSFPCRENNISERYILFSFLGLNFSRKYMKMNKNNEKIECGCYTIKISNVGFITHMAATVWSSFIIMIYRYRKSFTSLFQYSVSWNLRSMDMALIKSVPEARFHSLRFPLLYIAPEKHPVGDRQRIWLQIVFL